MLFRRGNGIGDGGTEIDDRALRRSKVIKNDSGGTAFREKALDDFFLTDFTGNFLIPPDDIDVEIDGGVAGVIVEEAKAVAGVGAVISFASASLPPASQRDQVPDYLRRA
ncbi:MAG: hypothetical protein EOP85_12590 [Verrucomicrobiaceae bacterium]|nr:MAG: hypothetical protein EOP85_12590 [Verrucomicrobiaceae bacterium]